MSEEVENDITESLDRGGLWLKGVIKEESRPGDGEDGQFDIAIVVTFNIRER